MFNKNCGCLIPAVIGIILGIIVGYFVFNFVIPGLLIAIWIALGISILAIALVFFIAIQAQGREQWCVCKYGSCIIYGAIATLFLSIIELAILILLPGILAIAILVGLSTVFLVFTIFSVYQFLMCLVKANCKCKD